MDKPDLQPALCFLNRERASGILLHPTSLPGPYGIGDLGKEAYRFVDFLVDAGQRVWQVLPLGPTGYGDSPYQSFSTFAGNPLLVSLERLLAEGWLRPEDLDGGCDFPAGTVDYGAVISWKQEILRKAHDGFRAHGSAAQKEAFEEFRNANRHWLGDYALFMVLKISHGYEMWTKWEERLSLHRQVALDRARKELADEIEAIQFAQFAFFTQWRELRDYCHQQGVAIIGDIPIYTAHDSADVWANRELFQLDAGGNPTVVAGVPPDYFSRTGQLWGNPIYRWDRLAETRYSWWVGRLRASLDLADVVRIDHFRGFEDYWEVPAGEPTAVNGRWVPGPKDEFFQALRSAIGEDLPIIAENLGIITPEVENLRKRVGLPGMAVLQFGLGHDARSSDLPPHEYERDTVAYTGTHDNEPILAWWKGLRGDAKRETYIGKYLDTDGRDFNWVCIRRLMESVANTTVFPLQDVLGLGKEARLNCPGQAKGNWTWRYRPEQLTDEVTGRLRDLTEVYGRLADDERGRP